EVRGGAAERMRALRSRSPSRDGEFRRGIMPCCNLEVRVARCGHVEPEDAYLLTDLDPEGNLIWITSCCGAKWANKTCCGAHPTSMALPALPDIRSEEEIASYKAAHD